MKSSEPKKKKRRWFLYLVVLPLAFFGLYTWSALSFSYSSGERAGYVIKLSKKGWLCKTWEGELAIISIPGSVPEKFYFSVPEDSVAQQINQTLGKRVAIKYEQHKGLPTSCFGETEYFVTSVKIVE